MQREASKHAARACVHQIHVFVARTVAGDLECRNGVAEMLLELMLRTECQLPHGGVQPVGTDHQIEPALASPVQHDLHAIGLLVKCYDMVVENGLQNAIDLLEQQSREI